MKAGDLWKMGREEMCSHVFVAELLLTSQNADEDHPQNQNRQVCPFMTNSAREIWIVECKPRGVCPVHLGEN